MRRGLGALALALALAPTPAAACAVCLDSAFGDRGFNLAFAAFMLTPFLVAAGVGGILIRLGVGRPARDPAFPINNMGGLERAPQAPQGGSGAPRWSRGAPRAFQASQGGGSPERERC